MKKALVIDDDLVTRMILVQQIEALGFMAIQSSNGRHGWETLWENQDVCLIVTDLVMPDMDGRELLKIIRGNESFKELPVIICSGVARGEEVQDLLALGHACFCAKPLDGRKLSELISQVMA